MWQDRYRAIDSVNEAVEDILFYQSLTEGINDQNIFKAVMMAGGPGCLAKGTKVLMADGTIKVVENIQIGEQVMGPDSKPRNILKLCRDRDEMFEVIPVKGEKWVCNRGHVLTLICNGRINENFKKNELYDITVDEYLSLHDKAKHYLKLIRSGVDYPDKPVKCDPHFIGIWIGDGTVGNTQITNSDSEVLSYVEDLAEKYNYVLGHAKDCDAFKIRQENWRDWHKNKNLFLESVRECVVNDEKRIPKEYLINSRQKRLELLAGLLDADSYYEGCYEIITKYQGLRDDILFLTRSLGLAAYTSEKIGRIKKLNFEGLYHRIIISGELDQIPCLVERKKAGERKQVKNVLRTGFELKSLGEGDYYGFQCDGDHRFLLGDFTITHNSGKSFIVDMVIGKGGKGKRPVSGLGAVVVNSDDLFEKKLKKAGLPKVFDETNPIQYAKQMEVRQSAQNLSDKRMALLINGMLPVVIDGTGKNFESMKKKTEALREIGYDTAMIFVNTSLDVALKRNAERERKVSPDQVEKMWQAVQNNIGKFQSFYGSQNFRIVDNSKYLEGKDLEKIKKDLFKHGKKLIERPLKNKIGLSAIEAMKHFKVKTMSELEAATKKELEKSKKKVVA